MTRETRRNLLWLALTIVAGVLLYFTLPLGAQVPTGPPIGKTEPVSLTPPPALSADDNRALDQAIGIINWTQEQVAKKQVELASAQAQAQDAQQRASELLRRLQKEGFDLDLEHRIYVPKKPAQPPPVTAPKKDEKPK